MIRNLVIILTLLVIMVVISMATKLRPEEKGGITGEAIWVDDIDIETKAIDREEEGK